MVNARFFYIRSCSSYTWYSRSIEQLCEDEKLDLGDTLFSPHFPTTCSHILYCDVLRIKSITHDDTLARSALYIEIL